MILSKTLTNENKYSQKNLMNQMFDINFVFNIKTKNR